MTTSDLASILRIERIRHGITPDGTRPITAIELASLHRQAERSDY